MYREGEPFTFIMPAAEAIYYPHGFRFVYRQRQIDGKVKDGLAGEGTVRPATLSDCPALARFAEEVLSETEWVRAVRTEEYYRTLVKEQQSEGGRILVTECKGQIRGFVLYGYWEGKAELREPLVYQEKDWQSLAAVSYTHLDVYKRQVAFVTMFITRTIDIKFIVVNVIVFTLGIVNISRSLSKSDTAEDIIEENDERNRLISLRINNMRYKILIVVIYISVRCV